MLFYIWTAVANNKALTVQYLDLEVAKNISYFPP